MRVEMFEEGEYEYTCPEPDHTWHACLHCGEAKPGQRSADRRNRNAHFDQQPNPPTRNQGYAGQRQGGEGPVDRSVNLDPLNRL
jgi:hypothetical protein